MKNLLCCFAVSLFLIPGLALAAAIPDPPTIDANSYALMDYDSGELIAASNPDETVAPASITQVLTTYIVFDEIQQTRLSPDDNVLIRAKAWRQGNDPSERSTKRRHRTDC